MGKVFIKNTRALNKINQVEAHAKYVGFRSKEISEKGFFGRDSNKVDYKEFVKRIEKHPALQHSKSIKAHKLIFSLKEVDYNAYLRSGKDYKDLVRKTLEYYENKHGVKLDWIANTHAKEGHPHCHVIIKGVSDLKDSEGKYKRIKFSKEDYKEMKEIFDKEFYKDVQYRPEELEKSLLDKNAQDKIMKDIANGFRAVTNDIAREAEKQQKQGEYERQRDVEIETQKNKKNKDRER